mmetsp:Transcript_4921/g.7180  ORF Transcript_4921/g.7180 Transcript_4921/m.7180 type:complete len:254 (-) Transcript_4921:313-1074(-)
MHDINVVRYTLLRCGFIGEEVVYLLKASPYYTAYTHTTRFMRGQENRFARNLPSLFCWGLLSPLMNDIDLTMVQRTFHFMIGIGNEGIEASVILQHSRTKDLIALLHHTASGLRKDFIGNHIQHPLQLLSGEVGLGLCFLLCLGCRAQNILRGKALFSMSIEFLLREALAVALTLASRVSILRTFHNNLLRLVALASLLTLLATLALLAALAATRIQISEVGDKGRLHDLAIQFLLLFWEHGFCLLLSAYVDR